MLYNCENTHGGNIYSTPISVDHSVNTNPLPIPEAVKRAIIDGIHELAHYPDPHCRALVEAIGQNYQVKTQHILCGAGACELIYSFAQAVKPKVVVELAPTFSEYALSLDKTFCQIFRYELKAEDEFLLDHGFLDYLKVIKPEVLYLCNPNNPTGRLIDYELLIEIIDFCEKQGITVFVDECFIELAHGGKSVLSLVETHEGLVILRAFTKTFSLAGLRVGFLVSSNEGLLYQMSETVQPWNVSILAQKAAIACLEDKTHLVQSRDYIKTEKPHFQQRLRNLGLKVYPSEANFFLIEVGEANSGLNIGLNTGLDLALREKGFLIRSCRSFFGLHHGFYRLACKSREENEQLLKVMQGTITFNR